MHNVHLNFITLYPFFEPFWFSKPQEPKEGWLPRNFRTFHASVRVVPVDSEDVFGEANLYSARAQDGPQEMEKN